LYIQEPKPTNVNLEQTCEVVFQLYKSSQTGRITWTKEISQKYELAYKAKDRLLKDEILINPTYGDEKINPIVNDCNSYEQALSLKASTPFPFLHTLRKTAMTENIFGVKYLQPVIYQPSSEKVLAPSFIPFFYKFVVIVFLYFKFMPIKKPPFGGLLIFSYLLLISSDTHLLLPYLLLLHML